MEQTIAGLGNRVFLMNNVHDDGPTIFQTRWTLSYLRGPLGREQIKTLMRDRKAAGIAPTTGKATTTAPAPVTAARPVVPPSIREIFLPPRTTAPPGATLLYTPAVLGTADIYFCDRKTGIDLHRMRTLIAPVTDAAVAVDFKAATVTEIDEADLQGEPEPGAAFAALPAVASNPKSYAGWQKAIVDTLYRTQKMSVFVEPTTEAVSGAEESERDFRVRLAVLLREARDAEADKLRAKYAPKQRAEEERLRKALAQRQKEEQEASTSKWTAAATVASSVLGAFLGRKPISATNIGRVGTAARSIGGMSKQSQDVARAGENVEAIEKRLTDLNAAFEAEVAGIDAAFAFDAVELETVEVRPKKADVKPRLLALAWLPNWKSGDTLTPSWT
jgi:hypothetical protein